MLSLDIGRRLRRIEIFRLVLSHRSRAESDGIALNIQHWEHNSPTESIVKSLSLFLKRNQAALLYQFFVCTFFFQNVEQRVPGLRRVADAKYLLSVGGNPAFLEIFARGLCSLSIKFRFPKLHRHAI